MAPDRRIDYDRIAATYDRYRHGVGPYLGRLAELAASCEAAHVVELGAGTGQSGSAFLECYPCTLTAIEVSSGMLAKGAVKSFDARWVQAEAQRLPLAKGCTRFLFSVYMLHHIADLRTVFAECARVLDSGVAAFITASHEYIERHPMNHYFPSFAAVEKARFQPIDDVVAALRDSGFGRVEVEHFKDASKHVGEAYADRVAAKFVSTYELLPPDEFEAGLARLRADIARTGTLETPFAWESTLVWGRLS